MSAPRVVYAASPDATPERERSAIAAALSILFEDEGENAAAGQSGDEDAKEIKDVRAEISIPG